MNNEYLKSGRQAIRLIYFIMMGFAITRSLTTLFIDPNTGSFTLPSLDSAFLFIIFFSFVSRFFLGAYRVLSYDVEVELRRPKIIIDIIGFTFQAIAFYVFSLNYYDLSLSQWMIVTICTIDSIWLLILIFFYHIWDSTSRQWIFHNILMTGFILINIYFLKSVFALFLVSLLAFSIDIILNLEFYFVLKTNKGLKIFVAGPYGDNQPPEIIAINVENAKQVGKALALKGHIPFIPHTMLHGWETDDRFGIDDFKKIDFAWLEDCDGLFFIAESSGANKEKEAAIRKGLQIFTSLSNVPDVKSRKTLKY